MAQPLQVRLNEEQRAEGRTTLLGSPRCRDAHAVSDDPDGSRWQTRLRRSVGWCDAARTPCAACYDGFCMLDWMLFRVGGHLVGH